MSELILSKSPAPVLTGTFLAADAPPDRWPAPAAVDPKIALLRSEAEAAPDKLFALAHAARLRALQAMAPNTQRGYDSDWRGDRARTAHVWGRARCQRGGSPTPRDLVGRRGDYRGADLRAPESQRRAVPQSPAPVSGQRRPFTNRARWAPKRAFESTMLLIAELHQIR
jgi:hypothetical protein